MSAITLIRFGFVARNVKFQEINYRKIHTNFCSFIKINHNSKLENDYESITPGIRLASSVNNNVVEKEGFIKKLLGKIPVLKGNRSKLMASGFFLYENIADRINYSDFYEELKLPDTFYSWFVITELHIWMLSVRTMAEGDEGKELRNFLLQALWTDVAQRVKRLGAESNPSIAKQQVVDLSEQLQAALIGYDEGLLSDDMVLAGAIWRRFYQQKEVEMHRVEKLVKYIRRQMMLLDQVSRNTLFENKSIYWLRFKEQD